MTKRQITPTAERFASKITIDNDTGCWLWNGFIDKNGYGRIVDGSPSNGWKNVRAHRYSYSLFNGAIPSGGIVCHACDNPSCVNPAHLWIGTHKQNTDDMLSKKRWKKPRLHFKLSENDVEKIRSDTRTHMSIANDYGIAQSTVTRIKNGLRRNEKTYKWHSYCKE
jgi:hypothetical protein